MCAMVNVHEAKTHFSKLLVRVEAGERIVIARAGKPVAMLGPVETTGSGEYPGTTSDLVQIMPDFDLPLPEFEEQPRGRPVKALLDTHTFLWWNIGDPQLSDRVQEIIADGDNEIWFSAASAWEIALKAGQGTLAAARATARVRP